MCRLLISVAAAVIRPTTTENLARAVAIAAELGHALVPRGAGYSYSGGTVPSQARSVVIDTSALDRVLEIDTANRLVRVQAGCTWATLLEALAPHGLRTPFFGPLSGFRSTVGGALSQRATFFGSAMHGFSDASVAGPTIVLADGGPLRTGMGHDGRPHPQPSGPDVGALFLGDCGAFGIKVEGAEVDFAAMQKHKAKTVKMLTGGVRSLLKRSEERRVGNECRSRRSPYHQTKKLHYPK